MKMSRTDSYSAQTTYLNSIVLWELVTKKTNIVKHCIWHKLYHVIISLVRNINFINVVYIHYNILFRVWVGFIMINKNEKQYFLIF